MNILYLDCGMGAAGDMLMGALLGLHPDPQGFLSQLNGLGIPHTRAAVEQVERCGIAGLHVRVSVGGQEEAQDAAPAHDHPHPHDHGHGDAPGPAGEHAHGPDGHSHTHAHRSLGDIEALIRGLPLPPAVQADALAVYGRIARAEAQVHGRPVDLVHFHEVGALDAVMDILGVCLLLHELKPDRILASPLRTGYGQVRCAHGVLPVPAPATALLLEGIPVFAGDIPGEMCTPTGAALLGHFVEEFCPLPPMVLERSGYGAGTKELPAANLVRALWGRSQEGGRDEIRALSCNLDDMSGETLAFARDALLDAGALDVFFTPIYMKKGRPGYMLTCLCTPAQEAAMAALLLRHTSTLGVRVQPAGRYVLARQEETVQTSLGPLQWKRAWGYGIEKHKFEYEDLARLARDQGLPLEELRARLEKEQG